jgi:DNA-binding MarR family transcriptional regulator
MPIQASRIRKNKARRRGESRAAPPIRLPLWSRPGYLIRRLHQIHVALFLEECKPFRMTPVQYGLLTALVMHGELDQVSLAEKVGIDRHTAAEVLMRLQARGLVVRKPSPTDRRAKLACVTPRGRKLAVAMFDGMQRAQHRLCAPLTRKERDAFMETLIRLIKVNNEYGRGALQID